MYSGIAFTAASMKLGVGERWFFEQLCEINPYLNRDLWRGANTDLDVELASTPLRLSAFPLGYVSRTS